jgi:hypothetical protein
MWHRTKGWRRLDRCPIIMFCLPFLNRPMAIPSRTAPHFIMLCCSWRLAVPCVVSTASASHLLCNPKDIKENASCVAMREELVHLLSACCVCHPGLPTLCTLYMRISDTLNILYSSLSETITLAGLYSLPGTSPAFILSPLHLVYLNNCYLPSI